MGAALKKDQKKKKKKKKAHQPNIALSEGFLQFKTYVS